jgi:TonB family protein
MFNNLIESNSHAQEYKRRGSFLLFITGAYAVLLLVGAVASIYAYDAQLEAQTTQLELLSFIPLSPAEEPPRVIRDPIRTTPTTRNLPSTPTRIELMDSTSNPNNVPDRVGTVASSVLPAPKGAVQGPTNYDPPAPSFAGRGVSTGTGTNAVTITDPPPPPPPAPTPVIPKVLKISHVLNSKAIELPRPTYPPLAKQIHVQGTVAVEVLIDESGKVVSAKAVSGHPLLVAEAVKAATRARFSPTIITGMPIKVQGVITYNFVMP